ncbi:MAG TPA: M4 family metallopeptidase, partial [Cystobacter sp.]
EPRLVYVRSSQDDTLKLAYEVVVTGEGATLPIRDHVFVNAVNGSIERRDSDVHTALNRIIYSAKTNTVVRTEGQPPTGDVIVDTTYDNLGETYNCYKTLFNRDSYNNAGATLKATVHYGTNYANAYWDGTQMVYGDGDGVNALALGLDKDVTTHELTHAVTEHTSNLTYSGESGGLNESMSDIFASVCESWSRGWAVDADVFKVGEDIWTPGTAGDALRYMDDPFLDGDSLDFYGDYSAGVDVHYSSGISNLVFALLSKGGTHPRAKTTQNVTAIGPEKAGRIFYKANTDLFTSSTTFEQAKTYTVQAAEALFGAGSAEAAAVNAAWLAVGVPPPPPVTTALTNGVPVSGLTGSSGNKKYYTLEVPAGLPNLVFDLSGGSGDADLYVRQGSVPTTGSYDCRSFRIGNTENCTFSSPAAGTWYVMIYAYTTYSGANLKATHEAGGPVSASVSGSPSQGQQILHGPYSVAAGSTFKVVMTGTGDPDLYVRFGSEPTASSYNCRPYYSNATEKCEL